MTALTARFEALERDPVLAAYPVADNVKIWHGGMVCLTAAGYLAPAADAVGYSLVVGVADESVDNTIPGHSAGGLSCRVRSGRSVQMNAVGLTQAQVGTLMYVVDDNTIGSNGSGVLHSIPAGVLVAYISATVGRVMIATPAVIGYATGAGGMVMQATSRTTGVTLNTLAGVITTNGASLAAESAAEFIVTNSAVAVTDVVVASIRSGANGGDTEVIVSAVAAGSFNLKVCNNNAAGGAAETGIIIINFAVIKAVAP